MKVSCPSHLRDWFSIWAHSLTILYYLVWWHWLVARIYPAMNMFLEPSLNISIFEYSFLYLHRLMWPQNLFARPPGVSFCALRTSRLPTWMPRGCLYGRAGAGLEGLMAHYIRTGYRGAKRWYRSLLFYLLDFFINRKELPSLRPVTLRTPLETVKTNLWALWMVNGE